MIYFLFLGKALNVVGIDFKYKDSGYAQGGWVFTSGS
jgi:hypothetical protein